MNRITVIITTDGDVDGEEFADALQNVLDKESGLVPTFDVESVTVEEIDDDDDDDE